MFLSSFLVTDSSILLRSVQSCLRAFGDEPACVGHSGKPSDALRSELLEILEKGVSPALRGIITLDLHGLAMPVPAVGARIH